MAVAPVRTSISWPGHFANLGAIAFDPRGGGVP